MRPFSSSTKVPQKLFFYFPLFLLAYEIYSNGIIPNVRLNSYLVCYTCFGLSALHKLIFQIVANESYNLITIVTAVVHEDHYDTMPMRFLCRI